jgi:hypothetical protein
VNFTYKIHELYRKIRFSLFGMFEIGIAGHRIDLGQKGPFVGSPTGLRDEGSLTLGLAKINIINAKETLNPHFHLEHTRKATRKWII